MDPASIFILLVLLLVAGALFFPGAGVLARLRTQRQERSSDRGMGTDAGDEGPRPLHEEPNPEQSERERTTFVPRD
jgi:hypothetical protein